MKTYRIFIVIIILLFTSCKKNNLKSSDDIEDNKFEYVLYNDLSEQDIEHILDALQNNYERIINDLKIKQMPTVTVKIWSDYDSFLQAMEDDLGIVYYGAAGYIFGPEEIRVFFTNNVDLNTIHEFAHIVSMQINLTIPNNPRWLWESVALYENNEFIDPQNISYLVDGEYPTITELNTTFNNSNHKIYQVGYILLEYIIESWGMDSVISLIENNGNLNATLGLSSSDFEIGWYNYLKHKYLNI